MKKSELRQLIREELGRLREIDFSSKESFDTYQKAHKMRPETQVTVAGKKMSVGQASKEVSPPQKSSTTPSKQPAPVHTEFSKIKFRADRITDAHAVKLGKSINTYIGAKNGYAQENNGAIEYNINNGSNPTYTLFLGPNVDADEPTEYRVSLEPSDNTNDPSKLQGKYDRSFKTQGDAVKFMAHVAKKHKSDLELNSD